MTQTAPVPGAFDLITAQATFAVDGNGSMNFVGIPQQQPANSRSFRVLNAVFILFSDNVNATIDRPYNSGGVNTSAMAFVIPNQKVNPGDLQTALDSPVPIASLGAGVEIDQVGASSASAGLNQVIYTIVSARDVVVPFGYTFGIWAHDSADGTPHNLTVTMIAQIQWLENPSAGCGCS